MSHPLTLSAITSTCWAVTPEKAEEIMGFTAMIARGGHLPDSVWAAARETNAAASAPTQRSGVGVIPVRGTISRRANLLSEFSGGTSIDQLRKSFREARGLGVKTIVLDMDSPGGSVAGVQEFADEIYQAREDGVKIIAVADTLIASAAYHIASSCSEIVCTPSGEVGSIGVYMLHMDMSAAASAAGVKPTFVYAGRRKVHGNPYEPLGGEAAERMQMHVDRYYDAFTKAVARGRGVSQSAVKNGFAEGDVAGPQEAKRLGMIDRIDTMDGVLARLGVAELRTGARAYAPRPLPASDSPAGRRARLAALSAEDTPTGRESARRRRKLQLESLK